MGRRKKARRKAHPLLTLLFLGLVSSLLLDNLWVRSREYSVSFPDLPRGFDGLRVLQISDLHGRDLLTKQLLVKAEEVEPDLILLTGDLVDADGQMEHLTSLLTGLTALAPVYYVTGNHEWALSEPEAMLRDLAAQGVTLLRNTYVTLERDGDRLLLAGLEDPNAYAEMKTPEELAAEMAAAGGGFSLLLAHRPEDFPDYAALGFRLVFSGHVHGGMLRLPLLGGLLAPGHVLFPEYDGGLFRSGSSAMVLSRGLAGVNGFPRLFNPIEVCAVTLLRG